MTGDEVRLVLPADPEYGRIARITAAGLALRAGMGFRGIEDLRIAVDESVILLLRPEGESGSITFVFRVADEGIEINATTTAGEGQYWMDTATVDRFSELVQDTVDEHDVSDDGRHVRLLKRFAA